jgi:hypothetical protein
MPRPVARRSQGSCAFAIPSSADGRICLPSLWVVGGIFPRERCRAGSPKALWLRRATALSDVGIAMGRTEPGVGVLQHKKHASAGSPQEMLRSLCHDYPSACMQMVLHYGSYSGRYHTLSQRFSLDISRRMGASPAPLWRSTVQTLSQLRSWTGLKYSSLYHGCKGQTLYERGWRRSFLLGDGHGRA